MARETHEEESRSIVIDCTFCDYQGIPIPTVGRGTCPGCGRSFSVQVTHGFTLVENDGWAVTVSLEAPGPQIDCSSAGESM